LPNLLDHYQKRETDSNSIDNIVIGALLGTSDAQGKQVIDISNSFPMVMKIEEEKKGDPTYIFDTEYLKKMLKFHKQVNELENILGVYISSTKIDKVGMAIINYMRL
jgi:hypothetical protein